ncbi:hypothetical protein CR513_14075, partial [Mucuna pruriens]
MVNLNDANCFLWKNENKGKNVLGFEDKGPSVGEVQTFQALVERQSSKKLNGLAEKMHKTLIERVLDVKYDHLRVFGCKAFVHVSNGQRSMLDMKTRQCMFIGYGQDEYGYRLYDPAEKKLVKIRYVQFMEGQTIKDINKVKKATPKKDNSLSEIDLVWVSVHDLDTIENNVQNGEQHDYVGDQQLGDIFYVPPDDNFIILLLYVDDMLIIGKSVSKIDKLKKQLSESKHIDVRYNWIRDPLDAKLLELAKVHTHDNGVDMMIKALPREKFEVYCEIVGLVISMTSKSRYLLLTIRSGWKFDNRFKTRRLHGASQCLPRALLEMEEEKIMAARDKDAPLACVSNHVYQVVGVVVVESCIKDTCMVFGGFHQVAGSAAAIKGGPVSNASRRKDKCMGWLGFIC